MVFKILPYAVYRAVFLLLAVFFHLIVHGQAPIHAGKFDFIDANINGFWQYLPRDYESDGTRKYPLLIFLHGSGESGSTPDQPTLNKLLVNGVPKLIHTGNFPETITVGSTAYRFIVISPQIKNGLQVEGTVGTSIIQPSTIDAVINYAKSAFPNRVDESRIYLAGLSMGGGAIWDYVGSNAATANKIAAVVVAAGAGDLSTSEANIIAASRLPVLATHNTVDNIVLADRTKSNIAKIKSYTPGIQPDPKAFFFSNGGPGFDGNHNSWSRTFEVLSPKVTSGGNVVDSLGSSVYEWMLQFSRLVSTPVTWEALTAKLSGNKVLVEWSVSAEQHIKNYEVERSQDGSGWQVIGTILPGAGTAQVKHYHYSDAQPNTGVNYYRIKQTDLDGTFTYSPVKTVEMKMNGQVKIFSNPFNDKLDLQVKDFTGRKLQLTIVSSAGIILRTENRQLVNGGSRITIDGLQSLAMGIYYILAKDEQGNILYSGRVSKNN
jgi:hypothetical protein